MLDSTVVFNELMYWPAQEGGALEWLELHNQMSVDMDISGWAIRDGVDYRFAEGTIVPGHGYVVVAADPEALRAATGYASAVGPLVGRLSNEGERLQLVNADGRRMDEITYGITGDWPVGPAGSGFSLAKRDENGASEIAANWTVSAQLGGTVGASNFPEPTEIEPSYTAVVGDGTSVRILVPGEAADLPADWNVRTYVDDAAAGWIAREAGVGFDTQGPSPLSARIAPAGDLTGTLAGHNASVFLRASFQVPDPSELDGLKLSVDYNDGFVAYLNGTEIVRRRAPAGSLPYNATADLGSLAGYAGYVQALEPSLYYRLDETEVGIVHDASGDERHAVHTTETSSSDLGRTPGALSGFDEDAALWAAGRRVDLTPVEAAGLVSGRADFSLSIWVKPEGFAGGDYGTFVFLGQASNGRGLLLAEDGSEGNGKIRLGIYGADFGVSTNSMIAGQWNHVGATYVAATRTFKLFLNGALDVTKTASLNIGTGGSSLGSLNAVQPYHGGLDEFAFFRRVLSDDEIKSLANPGISSAPAAGTFRREESDLESQLGALVPGTNVLAVQGLNRSAADTDFLLAPRLELRTKPGVPERAPQLVINEVAGASAADFFVEIANQGTEASELSGYRLSVAGSNPGQFTLPVAKLAPGEIRAFDAATLRFSVTPNDRLFLFAPGNSSLIDAQLITERLAGRSDQHDGAWLFPARATPGAVNEFHFETDIVINEIMYHHAPAYATADTAYQEDPEQWVELYNRGSAAVDLGGWQLTGAVSYIMPRGTSLAPGEYLVLTGDASTLRTEYPATRILGDWSGSLSNSNELLVLSDRAGNPADIVPYYDGGSWPWEADGNGSSLELRDPWADNARAEAWAASDETGKSTWQTITYCQTAAVDTGPANLWKEFVFGLLDAGEMLIDEVSVIADPQGVRTQLIQNGQFESDTVGTGPAKWRIIGNHQGVVVVDPTDATNQVLRLVATGHTSHYHDHAETTLAGNTSVRNGTQYEISFRAKWLKGAPQLNNRLYLTRVASTSVLSVPTHLGTPGAANSRRETNAGPTYKELRHEPVVPQPDRPVTISVRAEDPDGLASLELYTSVDGRNWTSIPMLAQGGNYTATVPGKARGTVVQFYVRGVDTRGAVSLYPAAGPDARALFQVDDGRGTQLPVDTVRLVMTSDDTTQMFANTNLMSNVLRGATFIRNNQEVFYDVQVHLKGSPFGRTGSGVRQDSFVVNFAPDQLYRGVHEQITLDASGRTPFGYSRQDEIIIKHAINHAGGIASWYDDLGYLISPRPSGAGPVIIQLARYGSEYLDESYADGSDGTVFEFQGIAHPTSTVDGKPESLKVPLPIGFINSDIRDLGDSKEDYRWRYEIKNNREQDDYATIIAMAKAFDLRGDALRDEIAQRLDVDSWMRSLAALTLTGVYDVYTVLSTQNLAFYVRPADGKVVLIPWDWDQSFWIPTNSPILGTAAPNMTKIVNLPAYKRLFHGHIYDLIQSTFNRDYLERWTQHFGSLVGQDFAPNMTWLEQRARYLQTQLIKEVAWEITTNGGNDLSVADATVSLDGTGWINVHEIRRTDTGEPLTVTWLDDTHWRAEVGLKPGAQTLTIEAFDFHGNSAGTDSITVTTTAANSVLAGLRLTEIQYHPAAPTAAESAAGFTDRDEFEYLEFTNLSDQTIPLSAVELVRQTVGDGEQGVAFRFADGAVTQLAPRQAIVVVEDALAFAARYGDQILVAGEWSGGLSNSGEKLMVTVQGALLYDFAYQDSWYRSTDGSGPSLELVDLLASDLARWAQPQSWRASLEPLGSPGRIAVPGDGNGDGLFDSSDFVLAFQAGKYEDAIPHNTSFQEGDWNGDGDFTSADLVYAFQWGAYENAASLTASRRARLTTGYTLVDRRDLSDATTEDVDWLNPLDVDALFDIWKEAE